MPRLVNYDSCWESCCMLSTTYRGYTWGQVVMILMRIDILIYPVTLLQKPITVDSKLPPNTLAHSIHSGPAPRLDTSTIKFPRTQSMHITPNKKTPRDPDTTRDVAALIELALLVLPVVLPVVLACAAGVPDEALASVVAAALEDVVDVDADVTEVEDAVYKLTSVLVPSTSEPPVAVPRLMVAAEVHIIAYSSKALAFDEGWAQ